MNPATVLVIEDDPTLLRVLRDNFELEGYRVLTAADGEAGLHQVLGERPDLVILDVMLPAINGYELCRRIREEGIDIPIIMLTVKDQESDIVLGLNLGADDYVTKPFSIKELLARSHASLRRQRGEPREHHRFGPFVLDLRSHQLRKEGEEIPLTPKEFELLALLVGNAGRAFGRGEILQRVWGHGVFVTGRSVDRCVNTLRKKLEPDAKRPRYIITVRDVGYRFAAIEAAKQSGEGAAP